MQSFNEDERKEKGQKMPQPKTYNIPQIVIDTITERAQFAYRASKDKRLLTDSNGKICRLLEQHFPVPVELSVIERIFVEAWIECAKGRI